MIDSTLFGASIPAGTYTKGDIIPLKLIDGPSVVRSGRGAAVLKRLTVGQMINASGSTINGIRIYVKNSDWIDPMGSMCGALSDPAALDEKSGTVQRGNNCPLTPNSSWEVWALITKTTTTTVGNSIFALLDIDYPSVSSIINPDELTGYPTSITMDEQTMDSYDGDDIETAKWTVAPVDYFKAGYEYALQKVELTCSTGTCQGFIAMSNAAGMSGLKRIMPITTQPGNIRNMVEYSSKLVKGPMDISMMFFNNTGTGATGDIFNVIFDYVKRRL